VALTLQKLCEKRAGRSHSQYEDPHGVGKTVSQERGTPGTGRNPLCIAGIGPECAGRCLDGQEWDGEYLPNDVQNGLVCASL
jgi:hypothetical protein